MSSRISPLPVTDDISCVLFCPNTAGRSAGTASPEVLERARQRQTAAAAAVARQQALCVPLISSVKLPAVLQGVASATGG